MIFSSCRAYEELQPTLEAFVICNSGGNSTPWWSPNSELLVGEMDFQPLPPSMVNMCNASGISAFALRVNGCRRYFFFLSRRSPMYKKTTVFS